MESDDNFSLLCAQLYVGIALEHANIVHCITELHVEYSLLMLA